MFPRQQRNPALSVSVARHTSGFVRQTEFSEKPPAPPDKSFPRHPQGVDHDDHDRRPAPL